MRCYGRLQPRTELGKTSSPSVHSFLWCQRMQEAGTSQHWIFTTHLPAFTIPRHQPNQHLPFCSPRTVSSKASYSPSHPTLYQSSTVIKMSFQDKATHQISQIDKEVSEHVLFLHLHLHSVRNFSVQFSYRRLSYSSSTLLGPLLIHHAVL